jgi:hypothetical protein
MPADRWTQNEAKIIETAFQLRAAGVFDSEPGDALRDMKLAMNAALDGDLRDAADRACGVESAQMPSAARCENGHVYDNGACSVCGAWPLDKPSTPDETWGQGMAKLATHFQSELDKERSRADQVEAELSELRKAAPSSSADNDDVQACSDPAMIMSDEEVWNLARHQMTWADLNAAIEARVAASPNKGIVWADEASPFTGAQVKALLEENQRLRNLLDPKLDAWRGASDLTLPEDEAIKAVFPTRSGRGDLYQEAQRMINARFTKYGLIGLVNWLLHRIEKAAERPWVCGACTSAGINSCDHKQFEVEVKGLGNLVSAIGEQMIAEAKKKEP